MRLMGLDVGDRTVGVAVSDLLGYTAQGVTTIRRKNLEQDLAAALELVKEYQVEAFVAGLPKHMNGDEGEAAAKAKAFAEALSEASGGLPVYYQDERLTTVAAQRTLLEGDVSRKRRKQVVDKLAAVFILQTYLDNPNNPK